MTPFKTLLTTAAVAVAVAGSPARAEDGKTFLLTVAVGSAPKMPTFRPLPQADRAATGLHDALLGMVPDDRQNGYRLMWTNRAGALNDPSNYPTVENVRKVLNRFAREATGKDRVVVVFLGHGFHVGDGRKTGPGYDAVVLGDSALADPRSFLTVREVVGRVTAMKCKDGAVFVDACREFRDDLQVHEETDYRPAGDTFAADLDRQERQGGRVSRSQRVCVVQACETGCFAYEEEGKGGLMTESLTLALSKTRKPEDGTADLDGDGTVTIHEAVGYARTRVQIHARNRHRAVQKLADELPAEAFALADIGKPAADAPAAAKAPPQAPAISYQNQTAAIAGGPPPTPVSQPFAGGGGYAAGGGSYPQQSLGNVLVGSGFDPNGPVGYGLGVVRPYLPPQAVPYVPQPGVSLLEFGLGFIRR